MLEERMSKHLDMKYIYLREREMFLMENGVAFTLGEYRGGLDLAGEMARRLAGGLLYDYVYARSTGILRRKRATPPPSVATAVADSTPVQEPERDSRQGGVIWICLLLAMTSIISMYISTLHTAVYLYDYVDRISAWLMSAGVTAYNSTAFEVSVLFKGRRRYTLTGVFMLLWVFVTLFSMATTVSVFYDRFNATEVEDSLVNSGRDAGRARLAVLRSQEASLREAVAFKRRDMEYRQEHEYATTAVRLELNGLEAELQSNLDEQMALIEGTPDATAEKPVVRESLFAFLGRLMHMKGGVLEFIMSTLSAVFVNLIAPLSLTAVTELWSIDKTKGVQYNKQKEKT